MEENCLKHNLMYLQLTKYNEINMRHSYVQKHVTIKNKMSKFNQNCEI